MPKIAPSRKFIDLIRQGSTSPMWASWDPPIEIKVGHYGMIDNETGELDVEGNIYDHEFQESLNQQGVKINLSDESCQPQTGGLEDTMIVCSSGVKQRDFSLKPEVSLLNLASASVKAEFQFREGKRGAILIMYKPQQKHIPLDKVLNLVYKSTVLYNKYLVTSTFTCPGYFIYMSNKSEERIAVALTDSAPKLAAGGLTVGGAASVDWWTDAQAGFPRKAHNKNGQYCYTPLYKLKHRQNFIQRLFRGEEEEETEDTLWPDCTTPWQPLDEDGVEDPVWEDNDEDFAPRSAVEGNFPFT